MAELDCPAGDGNCDPIITILGLLSSNVVVVAGNNGALFASRDNGGTFDVVQPGDPAATYSFVQIVNIDHIALGGLRTDPYLVVSENFDKSWNTPFVSSLATGGSPIRAIGVSDDGIYGACGADMSTQPIYYESKDGIQWTEIVNGSNVGGHCFQFAGNFYYSYLGVAAYLTRRQPDGSFATAATDGTNPSITDAAINGQVAVMSDTNNDQAIVSTDGGTTWNSFPYGGTASLCNDIVFGNGMYVARCAGDNRFYVSSDIGQSWLPFGADTSTLLTSAADLAFAGGWFYLVGDNGGTATVYRSADLVEWEATLTASGSTFSSVDAKTLVLSLISH